MEYLKAKLTRALIDHFGDDDRRIDHALAVTKWAERILEAEGGDEDIVLAVGLLHDVGIKEAEAIHGYNNGKMQEEYGPPIVRRILETLSMPQEKIDEACAIVGRHHTSSGVPGPNFPILWDADMIVNLGDELPDAPREKLESIIEKSFRTGTGKILARGALLDREDGS
ncbi:MAG: HD domain-containing protein [Armatimonadetes bacterium]|nr:HD domain-containing protein [Armatimonadota bacterium]